MAQLRPEESTHSDMDHEQLRPKEAANSDVDPKHRWQAPRLVNTELPQVVLIRSSGQRQLLMLTGTTSTGARVSTNSSMEERTSLGKKTVCQGGDRQRTLSMMGHEHSRRCKGCQAKRCRGSLQPLRLA